MSVHLDLHQGNDGLRVSENGILSGKLFCIYKTADLMGIWRTYNNEVFHGLYFSLHIIWTTESGTMRVMLQA